MAEADRYRDHLTLIARWSRAAGYRPGMPTTSPEWAAVARRIRDDLYWRAPQIKAAARALGVADRSSAGRALAGIVALACSTGEV